ncbi:class I SAM-dependent methyltransferase [Cyanobium sp. FGCU-6]|jgi:hypothetical protein|nr:class I SAM-dependent methyltransferase [Cyanobium sp. FGCU6]
MAGEPIEMFRRQWTTYRLAVDHDLMEHRGLTAALAAAIDDWLASRDPAAPAPHLVDLGCGDLGLLPPLLRRLPLASFTALDLNAAVLPVAEDALGPVPYPCAFVEGDLLGWAEAEGPAVDVVVAGPPRRRSPGGTHTGLSGH